AAGVVFFGITAYALGAALSEVGVPLLAHLTTYPSLERLFSDSGAADPIVFVGAPIPSFLFTVAVDTCAFGFALHGCTRKLANPARPATSRFGAIGLFVIAVVLGIGSSWTAAEDAVGASGSAIVLSYLLGSALVAMLTSGALVPSYLAVTRGIRRARRRGDHVGWFDDQGAGWPLALGFSVVVSGGFGMLAFAMRRGFASDHLVSMNMVWAVLSVATLILLLTSTVEFLRLCRRKSLGGSALLIGFALTVFPLLLMGIFSALKIDSAERYAAALSPLFGLLATAVRAASVWSIDYEAPPFAADGAAVLFSHVVAVAVIVFFQIQVTLVRRRLTLSLGPR
ncbi:MAG: hypothetical protein KC417_02835, partial [Myxococcales bacterium]|nr:hypothetical protein [Myxococcales bacterium]